MSSHPDAVVEIVGVQKVYGPVRVLNIDELAFRAGEIVALVGENGAGKSTLMGSLAGTVKPDLGQITIRGEVAMVSQEFPLVGQLSVGENLFLGTPPPGTKHGIVDFKELHKRSAGAARRAGPEDPQPTSASTPSPSPSASWWRSPRPGAGARCC